MHIHLKRYAYGALLVLLLAINLRVYAMEISNVIVTDVSPASATVKWQTDVNTDATVNYGLDSNFGTVRYPQFDKKQHELVIDNLDPSTQYHFRVVSSDEAGNKSSTAGFVFTTKGSQAQKIKNEIKKVVDPKILEEIIKSVQEQAADIVKPPAIVGPPKVAVVSDSATITWTTDRESSSMVYLAPADEYNSQSSDPYPIAQGDPRDSTLNHKVEVIGLKPSTEYHFKVFSEDDLGLAGESVDDTFTTKSILPKIVGVKVSRIQETSATISWSTSDVLAKGTVEYRNLKTKRESTVGDPLFLKAHSVRLNDLEFGTRYSAVISAINAGGDQVVSEPFTFLTVRDVVSPEIAKIKNESTLYPGEEVKVQTIVSWETDEPSYCQVFYVQGLGGPGQVEESFTKEPNPTTSHTQVIVGFAPATVYKYWVVCEDEARNDSRSEDFVLITPIKEKNIIDIILENFQGTFGWVNNVGK